ncbi:MAG: penicillin-binding protein 2 [Smithellaceae bacterium]
MENRLNLLNGPDTSEFRRKFKIFFILLLIIFSVLLIRLWYLQIIKGGELKQRSEINSVRFRKIKPLRGLIMDRKGRLLVDNLPSFDVVYMPGKVKDQEQLIEKLKILYKRKSLQFVLDRHFPKIVKPYLPITLEKNVGMEKVALVETNSMDLPGVYIDVSPVRLYLDGEMMAPVIGYTGEASKEELEEGDEEYTYGDILGKHGVEKALDAYIRGRDGAELVEVNVYDKEIKNLGRIEPVPGYNAVLTIDADLQKAAWQALKGKAGAAVALDPRDGSVLAMISSPSFDPHLFNSGISYDQWDKLQNSPLAPMSNRAISGQYPPGSTYKLIVAAAALEEGIITPDTKFSCNGFFKMGNKTFKCWKNHGHGSISLHRAIVESCDVYFYNVGKLLGPDKIAKYAKLFGLGEISGVDLPNEKNGIVPTEQWKLARMKEPWQPGETISIAIGQGYDLVTPLQLVNAYSAFANGGTVWQPRIIKRIESIDGKIYKEFPPVKNGDLTLSKKTFDILNHALWGVVNEQGGTGGAARILNADVCGKTGTAQVISLPKNEKRSRQRKMDIFLKDHALFVCYAPLKDPEIAVAVIVENAGHGGSFAAPIARKILETYFEEKAKQPKVMAQNLTTNKLNP